MSDGIELTDDEFDSFWEALHPKPTPPPERAILTDLIAELRSEHYPHECTDPEDFPCCCQNCRERWPCSVEAAARSAEARLREVTDE